MIYYENRFYFTITDDNNDILTCCIKESSINSKDLEKLDKFLAYYKQNYKIRVSIFEENIDHVCNDINEIRKHIIDVNKEK